LHFSGFERECASTSRANIDYSARNTREAQSGPCSTIHPESVAFKEEVPAGGELGGEAQGAGGVQQGEGSQQRRTESLRWSRDL